MTLSKKENLCQQAGPSRLIGMLSTRTSLKILPTTPKSILWGELKDQWRALLDEGHHDLLGQNPNLLRLGTGEIVKESDTLKARDCYYLELATPNTLGIVVNFNADGDLAGYEQEYLQEMGKNLNRTTIQAVSKKWASVGYAFRITSSGGRSKHESRLMIALAVALAILSDGYIVVNTNNVFDVDEGIYNPEQFKGVTPKF